MALPFFAGLVPGRPLKILNVIFLFNGWMDGWMNGIPARPKMYRVLVGFTHNPLRIVIEVRSVFFLSLVGSVRRVMLYDPLKKKNHALTRTAIG